LRAEIEFLGKILDSYSVDRLETEYCCSGEKLTNVPQDLRQ